MFVSVQLSFCEHHSTETALSEFTEALLMNADLHILSLLPLHDMSATKTTQQAPLFFVN